MICPQSPLHVNQSIQLEVLQESHAVGLFQLIDQNRSYLQQWLSFPPHILCVDDARQFIVGSRARMAMNSEVAFVVVSNSQIIGRFGVYKIDLYNKMGEIGYWLGEEWQGKGIATLCSQFIIDQCFTNWNLNRIEIRCAEKNVKSQGIPERLHFKKEGILMQAEYLHDRFQDLLLYAKVKLND